MVSHFDAGEAVPAPFTEGLRGKGRDDRDLKRVPCSCDGLRKRHPDPRLFSDARYE